MELRKAWCAATAHPSYQKDWTEDNPSYGQCCVTALAMQDLYGGDIYSCKVGNNSHFVNIIDERIIDKTAEQFGGTDKIKYVNGSFRKRSKESLLKNKDVKQRYELLKTRMEEN
jgi:hypothetical protein